MAFATAPGYTNLPRGNFVPVIYSSKVQKYFRKTSVVSDITNNEYFGEISGYGDTVNIIKEPTISIGDYARGTRTVSQALDDDQLTLTVDQAKYFQFEVDDIEQKQAHLNWIAMATSAAAYALKDDFDSRILTYIRDNVGSNIMGADTLGNSTDVGFGAGETSPLAVLSRLSRLLDEDNVPTDNRWFVARPVFWEQVQDENSKLLDVDYSHDDSSLLRNGRVTSGLIRGFRCYSSNNLPLSSSQSFQLGMAGHMSAVSTASQIVKMEKFRSTDTFADVVRGLHVYGRKMLRSDAVAVAYMTID